jgi:hypothetical protein
MLHFSHKFNSGEEMKKYLLVFCLASISLTTSFAFANYLVVTADQVTVTSEGMFVTVDGLSVPVESINSANDGFLVAVPTPNAGICPSCGRDGYNGRYCKYCGFPDDGRKSLKNAVR